MDTKDLIPTGGNIRKTDDGMFSVIDIIREVTEQSSGGYKVVWQRIKKQHPELVTKCYFVGMKGVTGKESAKKTPVCSREVAVEIILLLPGMKAAKFRAATAKLVLQYLDADPSLVDSVIARTDDPAILNKIALRAKSKAVRNQFTHTLAAHGVNGNGYRDCTNAIYTPFWGGGAPVVRQKLGLPEGANTRDAMTPIQLTATMLAEEGAGTIIERQDRRGNEQCEDACLHSSNIIADAIKKINDIASEPRTIFNPKKKR